MRFLIGIALLASIGVAHASPCPQIELQPKVITPDGTAVAKGVLVAWLGTRQRMQLPYDEHVGAWTAAKQPTKTTELAPGLAVISGDAAATSIVDKGGKLVAKFTIDTSSTAKPPPAPTGFTVVNTTANPKTTRHVWSSTTATFTAAPPKGAVALVAIAGGKPVTFGLVVGTDKEVTIYSNTTCNPHPAGTVAIAPKQSVQLAWVDAAGRMSKPSAAVTVAGKIAN